MSPGRPRAGNKSRKGTGKEVTDHKGVWLTIGRVVYRGVIRRGSVGRTMGNEAQS